MARGIAMNTWACALLLSGTLSGAALAQTDSRVTELAFYEQTLKHDAENSAAMMGILWLHIENLEKAEAKGARERQRLLNQLARTLDRFRDRAWDDVDLWRAYAAAALLRDDHVAALRWFARGARVAKRDPLWLVDWAQALQQSGRTVLSHAVLREAFIKLQPLARRAAHKQPDPRERELLRTYIKLLAKLRAAGDSMFGLRQILAADLDRSLSRELLQIWRQVREGQGLFDSAFLRGRLIRLRGTTDKSAPPKSNAKTSASRSGADAEADDDDDDGDDDGDDDDDDSDDAASSGAASTASASSAAAEDESEDPDSTRSRAWLFGTEAHGLGELSIASVFGRADFSFGRLGISLRGSYAYLSVAENWISTDSIGLRWGEIDLAALAKWRLSRGRLELGIGGNLRAAQNLAYGSLHGDYDFGHGLSGELNLGMNQIVDDTLGLRLIGARDRLGTGVYFDLTQREFVNLVADWHRYQSRAREPLSDGYVIYLEAGHRLRLSDPGWNVRLTGYWEQNFVVSQLPSGLAALLTDASVNVTNFVVPQFGMVGAATTLRRGMPGVAPADDHRLRYFAELWLGYLWPLNSFGYDAQIGIGLSARRLGELSVSSFVSNSRYGGGAVGLIWGAGLRYVY